MKTSNIEILGYILLFVAKRESSCCPFFIDSNSIQGEISADQSWEQFMKACDQLAERIPRHIRDVAGKEIQTRRGNNPVAQQLPGCRPKSINAQVSQTTREVSQSTGASIPSSIQAGPHTGIERVSQERISSSSNQDRPLAQKKRTPRQKDPPPFIFLEDLQSWARSANGFLNVDEINIDQCCIAGYITKLDQTQYFNAIRLRFALLQLFKIHQQWHPRPMKTFRERLGTPKSTFNAWISEGRNYSSLVSQEGPDVLFAELKSRTQQDAEIITPSRKKRRIDDPSTGGDTETKGVKKKDLTFTSEELELPKVYVKDEAGKVVEFDESPSKAKELFKTAAENIIALFEGQRQNARLLDDDESRESWSATNSCQSMYCSVPATNDDAMVDAGQFLRQSPTERTTDDGISSYGFGCTSTNSTASLPAEQVAIRSLQEHTSWNATGHPSPSLVEPRQEGTSSGIGDAYNQQPGSTPNTRFSPTSLTPSQLQSPSSQPASGPRAGHISQAEGSRLSELFPSNGDHALASIRDSTFDAQATNYPGANSPKLLADFSELLEDDTWGLWYQ
ncbi:uncharacterized protein FPRO_14804 [Fusarium proliferatum ET1]|uniref:Uncharacterized protein n=1 Tax=Fusarium proliferatum (strain ET1) TaxID=1227346 RepID=A0A1L7WAV5_FUSPR|nr:uncharacterized protein FPRO_14804 [Fusarium proliferatum ET1]CZR49718.1 uncharacterized protein FPRO_14804 [Fusarium proliferatum ET1]